MSKFQKLKELTFKIGSGATPTGGESNYKKEGIALIRSQNVHDLQFDKNGLAFIDENQARKLNNVIVEENDVLLNITGDSIARACMVPKEVLPARVNQHVAIIRVSDKICSRYLLYYLISRKKYLLTICGVGGTRNALTKEALENIEIRVDKDDRRIATILSTLDDKIELNNKIDAELEAMARTLYDYWFAQFDFPDCNGKPYKSSFGKMEYDKVLKRDVPVGWEVKRLGSICSTSLGGTPSTKIKEFWDGNISWLNSGEVADFPIVSSEAKISESAIDKSATKLLKKGTVLISITRHLRANILGIDACVNQSVVGIEENDDYKKSFIYLFIKNEIPRLMTLRTGAQQPHINKETVDDCHILKPSDEILNKYYNIAEPIFELIILNAKQNQELAALRDWLLPMLMNGQVTVAMAKEKVDSILSFSVESNIILK